MILVDTSIWIDHLRRRDAELVALLQAGVVMCHAFVIGELACGALRNREEFVLQLSKLPRAPVAAHDEALRVVDRYKLSGRGIGWIDTHLLTSAFLAGRAQLLTRDKRLRTIAGELGLVH